MNMKNNISPKTAAELLFIINQFPYSKKQKISVDLIEYLKQNYDKTHYSNFKQNVPFTKQTFSNDTSKLMKIIFEKSFNK